MRTTNGLMLPAPAMLIAALPMPTEAAGLSVGYCEYTYPSGGGDADREVSLLAKLGVPLSPSLSVNYGIDGGVKQSLYVEASAGAYQFCGGSGRCKSIRLHTRPVAC